MDIGVLEAMIGKGQDSALLRLTLARLLAQNGQWERATGHLNAALEADPAYSAAWKELGLVRQSMGDEEGALNAWRKGADAARVRGDKQAEKEMGVFIRRLSKARTKGPK